jgi:hypothetical protein
MVLTTYHHLVPRLRISGCILLLHLYALMVWARTTLLLNFAYTLYASVTSGHFVRTSSSLSWDTVLSKLGNGVVPWVNFWFTFFCFNRITCERLSNSVYCCTFIWEMALLSGKWHLNERTKSDRICNILR